MYMEHDLYENTEAFEPIAKEDNQYVDNSVLVMMTDKGENPVYRDVHGRCHLTLAKELCLLSVVEELSAAGLSVCRIEGATYRPEQLKNIVRAYRSALDKVGTGEPQLEELNPVYAGFTLGALQFDGDQNGEAKDSDTESKTEAEVVL